MVDSTQVEPLKASVLQRLIEKLFNTYIPNPQAPQVEQVEDVYRLVTELAQHEAELEEQNQKLLETQQHLEAYRDRYIDLYDFAPLGYATLDEDGYVQEINLAGAELLGAEREALTGYAFGNYVAQEDLDSFLDHLRTCAREHREITSEFHLVNKDGQSITVQLHSIPIEGPKEYTLCKTAITDITQRRNMEETIRKSRTFLQTVIDAIPDTMLVVNRDYRIVLANRAAREMAGGIDLTACATCYKISHHRDAPCEGKLEPCPVLEVIKTKSPMTVKHTHFDAEGKEVYVEVNAAPVFNEAGEVTHIIEACRDITAREQAEKALQQERNLLRTLIDNLPDYIYVKDTQCRFVAANLAAARIMGVTSPSDLLGKTDYDFYPRELAEEYRADEEQIIKSGLPLINKDEPHLDPSGNSRIIMTSKVPLKDSKGKVVGLVGISCDITERKQAVEEVHAMQQNILDRQLHEKELVMAELDKVRESLVRQTRLAAVGQLSATIAHELRTPFAGISFITSLLKRKISQGECELHEYLDLLGQEVENASRIITNCTAISRGGPPKKIAVALASIIAEAQNHLDAPEGKVEWRFHFDREPFTVYTDAAQMKQVLKNLFINAIQAFDGPGRIILEAATEDRYDVIRVQDNGVGIPRELREQIFEPLVTTKPSGCGLGLTICRQIIEQHGGQIELISGDGPGTVFQIRLPAIETKPE